MDKSLHMQIQEFNSEIIFIATALHKYLFESQEIHQEIHYESLLIALNYISGSMLLELLRKKGEYKEESIDTTQINENDSPLMIYFKNTVDQLITFAKYLGYSKDEFYELTTQLTNKIDPKKFECKAPRSTNTFHQSTAEMMEILQSAIKELKEKNEQER